MKVTLSDGSVAYLPGPGHIDYFAAAEPPEGYLVCNGGAVKRASFPELFAVIGTTFGAGDGETTFNLPPATGKFFRSLGGNAAALGTTQAEGLPNITGNMTDTFNGSSGIADGAMSLDTVSAYHYKATWADSGEAAFKAMRFSAANSNSIYGASSHVTTENIAFLPCIKY